VAAARRDLRGASASERSNQTEHSNATGPAEAGPVILIIAEIRSALVP
jgi:hypothetical protein